MKKCLIHRFEPHLRWADLSVFEQCKKCGKWKH